MRLLITRPLEQSELTAESLEHLYHECMIEPLLTVKHLHPDLPKKKEAWDGVLVTSQNAVPAMRGLSAREGRSKIPVLAVGAATRMALFEEGFHETDQGGGSALDMISRVPGWLERHGLSPDTANLLYPSARKTAHDLTALLAAQNIRCVTWRVYETHERESFSQTTKTALENGALDGVLLYSPRTARCFSRLLKGLGAISPKLKIFALSEAIANALDETIRNPVYIASKPNEDSLFALIAEQSA